MKKTTLGILAASTALFLSACGTDASEKDVVKIGEILKTEKAERVSFVASTEEDTPFNKDASVDRIIFTKDGKVKVYYTYKDIKILDVVDKDIDELEELATKQDKLYFDKTKENELEKVDNLLEGLDGTAEQKEIDKQKDDIKELKKDLVEAKEKEEKDELGVFDSTPTELECYISQEESDLKELENSIKEDLKENKKESKALEDQKRELKKTKYKEPEYRDLKIAIETDGSGNHTDNEKLYVTGYRFSDTTENAIAQYEDNPKEVMDHYLDFEELLFPVEVKDSRFAGLADDNQFFVTTVGDKTKEVDFDQPDDDYVNEVDGEKK